MDSRPHKTSSQEKCQWQEYRAKAGLELHPGLCPGSCCGGCSAGHTPHGTLKPPSASFCCRCQHRVTADQLLFLLSRPWTSSCAQHRWPCPAGNWTPVAALSSRPRSDWFGAGQPDLAGVRGIAVVAWAQAAVDFPLLLPGRQDLSVLRVRPDEESGRGGRPGRTAPASWLIGHGWAWAPGPWGRPTGRWRQPCLGAPHQFLFEGLSHPQLLLARVCIVSSESGT